MAGGKPFLDQLAEAHDEVVSALLAPIRQAWQEVQEDSPFTALLAFFNAVDWKEPWLVGLLVAQVALFVSVVAMRRSTTYLTVVFCFGAAVICLGEHINAFAAAHWRRFAAQPYFDPRGAFYAAVIAGPLVLTLFSALILYLLQVAGMMVRVKKLQLQHEAAQRRRQGHGDGQGRATQGQDDSKKRS